MYSPIIAFVAASVVVAWGNDGHSTVGNIAQHYLNEHSKNIIAYLFPEYNGTLGTYDVAASTATLDIPNWADLIKANKSYAWAYQLHFVDALDAPPSNCSYIDERDCPNNLCVTGAIANYTRLASCDAYSGLPKSDQQKDAIRFLAHFSGDITQPLHVCNRSLGGNQISPVTFDGAQKKGPWTFNLHSIWDYYIPEKRINTDFGGDYKKFQDYLVKKIDTDSFDEKVATFLSDKGIYDLTKVGNSAMAVDWAVDTNFYDCSKVWGPVDADRNQDFGGAYYQDVIGTVEKQIAKGGYRLANLLNKVLAQCKVPAPVSTESTTAQQTTTTAGHGNKPILSSASSYSVSIIALLTIVSAL
ncbi:hypothetical protein HDV06_002902 [Boothiomyces sp. JEL0866]|nr:hypothetical protein HDV06_002902 [Boothiomyces sp. JEL0866]